MHRETISMGAIAAGIGVLVTFSFLAGGYQSFSRGIDASRQGLPLEELEVRELERLQGDPVDAMDFLVLGIQLAGIFVAGFAAALVAKRNPVTHGVIVGGLLTSFLILVFIVILMRYDVSASDLWEDAAKILLAVPLSALGGSAYRRWSRSARPSKT